MTDQTNSSIEQKSISPNTNNTQLDNILVNLDVDDADFPSRLIKVTTTIENALSEKPVSHTMVIIEAFSSSTNIFKSSQVSDNKGQIVTSFPSPTGEDIKVTAKLFSDTNTPAAIVVLPATSSWSLFLSLVLILFAVAGAFAVIVFMPYMYQKYTIVFVVILIVAGFVVLYLFSPLNETGNATLSAVLFSPIAAFMIDLIKKKSEANAIREESVGNYIRETLQQEIVSIVNIHDEIRQHSALLKAKHIVAEKELSTKMFNESKKTGTMANFPTRRVYRYYYYVDTINKLLKAKSCRTGNLQDDRNYENFCKLLEDIKVEYSELNDILYRNVLYNIGEIQNRFLSFPTVNFPARISGPLIEMLDRLNIITVDRKIVD